MANVFAHWRWIVVHGSLLGSEFTITRLLSQTLGLDVNPKSASDSVTKVAKGENLETAN